MKWHGAIREGAKLNNMIMSKEKTSRITVRKTETGVNVYLRYRGADAWEKMNNVYKKYEGQEIRLKISYDK